MSDLLAADATEQLSALRSGRIGALELLELELERNAAQNPRTNAVVTADADRARKDAKAIDEARIRGRPLGPLAGLPMTIKDTYDVEGLPASGGGVAEYLGRDCADAVVVARARAAGAVIWGKTNSPPHGGDWQSHNKLYGATNNPWDLTRTSGGSSGGAAAVLATQVSALEMGSDIAGSLRVPAAFCGVVAHKPTLNFLSMQGHIPPGRLAPGDLTVVGPMARTVRDLALLLNVMSGGETPVIVPPAAKSLRIGLWLDDPAMVLDEAVRGPIEAFAERLRAAGHQVTPMTSPVEATTLLATYNFLLMSYLASTWSDQAWRRFAAGREAAKAEIEAGAGPLSYAATLLAATSSHREWRAVDETRWRLKAQMSKAFERVDVIVTPVAPVEPFRHDHSDFHRRELTLSDGRVIDYAAMKTWVALATTCGLPATAIPAGLSAGGLPIGVQVIAPEGGDIAALSAALALEEAAGGYRAPPL